MERSHPYRQEYRRTMSAGRGQLTWWVVIVLALLRMAGTVGAHPISISAVAVNVQEDQVLANMKIMLEDLVMYHGLQAGAEQRFTSGDLEQAAARHGHFVQQYFTIHNAAGQPSRGNCCVSITATSLPLECSQPNSWPAMSIIISPSP